MKKKIMTNLNDDRKAAALVFLLAVAVYFFSAKGYLLTWDSQFSLNTAESIIKHKSILIEHPVLPLDSHYLKELPTETYGTKIYSKYGVALPLLWIPYVLLGNFISEFYQLPQKRTVEFVLSFYNVFFGAGSCGFFFYFMRYLGSSRKKAVIGALLLAFVTLCWNYSTWDYSEVTQMFFLLIAVLGLIRCSIPALIAGSLSFGYLLLIKPTFVIYAPILFIYLCFQNGKWDSAAKKRVSTFSAVFLFFLVLILALNAYRFQHPLIFGYAEKDTRFLKQSWLSNLNWLLFSWDYGLFIFCPILLICLWGYKELFKSHFKESLLFLAILGLNAAFFAAYAGLKWASPWGPRYLVPCIPFYLIGFVGLRWNGFLRRAVFIALVFWSVSVQVLGVLQSSREYYLIRMRVADDPYFEKMDPTIIGVFKIFVHKLKYGNNLYKVSDYGLSSDQIIDMSQYESYHGFDLWYAHLNRYKKSKK